MVEFRNVLRLNPKNADAIYHIGLIHERGERLKPALAAFQQATVERPDFIAAQAKYGTLAFLVGELDIASKAAERLEKLDPGNADGLFLKGALALRNGEPQAALDLANAALEKAPEHELAVGVLIGAYAKLGETDHALKRLDEALAASPKSIPLHLLEISLLQQTGDIDGMAKAYGELFALEPEKVAHRLELADFYWRRNELPLAEAVLQQAIEDGLVTNETVEALVRVVRRTKGPDAAEAALRRLIERDPENYALQSQLAGLFIQSNRMEDAEHVLGEMMTRASPGPLADGAQAAIAQLKLALGDQAEATRLAEEVVARNAEHPVANLVLGMVALSGRDLDEAIRRGRLVLRQNPNWIPGLKFLAEAHLAKGEQDLAIDSLTEIVKVDPTDAAAVERLAELLTERGDYDAALKLWNLALEIGRNPAQALKARTQIAIQQGNWAAAESDINRLLVLPDQHKEAALLAGDLLTAQSRFADSREWYTWAEKARGDAPEPMIGLVRTYLAEDDVDGALDYLGRRTAARPEDVIAYEAMGEILSADGRTAEARQAFEQAIRLRPGWPTPYRSLGYMLRQAGDAQSAVSVYRSALEQRPDDPDLLGDLAEAYQAAGQVGEAIDSYARLLKQHPDLDEAASSYAALIADYRYQDPDALSNALQVASRFRTSDDPAHLDTLGWLHYRQGDFPVATTFLERAVSFAGNRPEFRYHLGMALYRTGQNARALSELERATVDGTSYPGVEEARATYARLLSEQKRAAAASKEEGG